MVCIIQRKNILKLVISNVYAVDSVRELGQSRTACRWTVWCWIWICLYRTEYCTLSGVFNTMLPEISIVQRFKIEDFTAYRACSHMKYTSMFNMKSAAPQLDSIRQKIQYSYT